MRALVLGEKDGAMLIANLPKQLQQVADAVQPGMQGRPEPEQAQLAAFTRDWDRRRRAAAFLSTSVEMRGVPTWARTVVQMYVLLTENIELLGFQLCIIQPVGEAFNGLHIQPPRRPLARWLMGQLQGWWPSTFLSAIKQGKTKASHTAADPRGSGAGASDDGGPHVRLAPAGPDLTREVGRDGFVALLGDSLCVLASGRTQIMGARKKLVSTEVLLRARKGKFPDGQKVPAVTLQLPRVVRLASSVDPNNGRGSWLLSGTVHGGGHRQVGQA